ncbi:MAG: hypothetical protein Salg2KO_02930 [Salibacteraceae bacterium]
MGSYSIKDLEKLSGIKAHTIRVWEQRYSLIEPKRTETNIRYYDDEQLKLLLNVSLLSKNGFKISKISQWSDEEFADKLKQVYDQSLLHKSDIQIELSANDLVTAMIDMDASKFERIYESSILKHGFKKTIKEVIYPFLEKVGILWTIGQINPAQEHFVSCLVRQKVIAAIDRLENNPTGKRFLLFLPEGEHHELGLLLAHYILKENNQKTFYLGQNLPSNDIKGAIETVQADYVLTFLVDPGMVNNAKSVVTQLLEFCGKSKLLIATRLSEELNNENFPSVQFMHGMDDLLKVID